MINRQPGRNACSQGFAHTGESAAQYDYLRMKQMDDVREPNAKSSRFPPGFVSLGVVRLNAEQMPRFATVPLPKERIQHASGRRF